MSDLIEAAIRVAPKVFPEYIAQVLIGQLRAPAPIPVLQDHQHKIAEEILTVAVAKVDE